MAFSTSMFSQVNENDARAAIKAWIMTVAKDIEMPVDPDPHIHRGVGELLRFGRTHSVDGFGLTLPEYAAMSRDISFDRIAVGIVGGHMTEEYLLLVRHGSDLKRLEQLRGRTLNVLHHPRMSLALIWLDTALLETQLAPASEFLGKITLSKNTSQVALPVFFGKTDACVLTRMSFDVMGELNPQLNNQLRVLAVSPPLIPTGFAFRTIDTSPYQSQLLKAMEQLGKTPAGRQILMLIQADRIEGHPVAVLGESLELLAKHRGLCAPKNGVVVGKSDVSIPLPNPRRPAEDIR